MDASDGANKNGNGHADPEPVSLPSAAAPPPGGPVEASPSWKSMAEESSGPPIKRKKNGTYEKGQCGNEDHKWKKGQSGNPLGIQSYNKELWTLCKKLKVTDAKGHELPYLEALLKRGLQEKDVLIELIRKFMADPTPAASGVTINNNPSASATAANSDTHVNVAKLIADGKGREAIAGIAERLAACGAFPGRNGNGN